MSFRDTSRDSLCASALGLLCSKGVARAEDGEGEEGEEAEARTLRRVYSRQNGTEAGKWMS